MALHNSSQRSWAWLVVISGVFALMTASCENTCDSGRQAVGDPSAGSDPPSLSAGAGRGRQLFQTAGCLGCHMVHGRGGRVGPDLSNEGNAGHSRQWLQTQVRNPRSHDPQTMMPAFDNLSDQQVKDLVDYLESLKTAPAERGGEAPSPRPQAGVAASAETTSLVTTGGKLWGRTCGQCHNLRPPSEYSDAQWAVAVHHMRARVPLTGEEQRDIVAFLQASN
jgi:mono/diheme cytochrome c family protein